MPTEARAIFRMDYILSEGSMPFSGLEEILSATHDMDKDSRSLRTLIAAHLPERIAGQIGLGGRRLRGRHLGGSP